MNKKYTTTFLFFFSLLSIFTTKAYAAETLTLTTYYPAPYGVYIELRAQQMAVGATYFNPTTAIPGTADLIVEDRVGIGTASPNARLHVITNNTLPIMIVGDATTAGTQSLVMGVGATAVSTNAVAIGPGAIASVGNDIAIGNGAFANDGVAIGQAARAPGNKNVAIGQAATAGDGGHGGEVAVGWRATVTNGAGVAIGENSQSQWGGVALGRGSIATGSSSVALAGTTVTGDNSVGIGLNGGFTLSQANTMAVMGGCVGVGTTTPAAVVDVLGNASGSNVAIAARSTGCPGIFTVGQNGIEAAGAQNGIYATGFSNGVYGVGSGSAAAGVLGQCGNYGVYGMGGNYGVYGYGNRNGVIGVAPGGSDPNSGDPSHTSGVYGSGSYIGVRGVGSDYGVWGSGQTGVTAYGTGWGMYTNGGTYGILSTGGTYGVSTSGSSYGVYATSSSCGVYGYGPSFGLYGSAGVYGVYGYSSGTGIGVYGYSYHGLWGTGTSYGVVADGGVVDFQANGAGINYNMFPGEHINFLAKAPGVKYATFTGAHDCLLPKDYSGFKSGMIVSSTGQTHIRLEGKNKDKVSLSYTLPTVKLADKPEDKSVFGVYVGLMNQMEHWYKGPETKGLVNAVGEGRVLVTDINGAIEAGDYITTSVVAGYGQKQSDDLVHSYTLGKATESVDWDKVKDTVEYEGKKHKACLIAVTYTSG